MAYLRWLVFTVLSLLATVVGIATAPIVVLFANSDGWLPKRLSYWQTPKDSLDGDGGWRNEHWQWRYKLPLILAIYVGRVGWLWRNTMYGFCISVLGVETRPTDILVCFGDPLTGNRPLHEGRFIRKLYRDGKLIAWQYYYVKRWHDRFCLRVNLGWKLWDFSTDVSTKCQHVFSPNPFMGFSS